jgi:Phage tail lysozyme
VALVSAPSAKTYPVDQTVQDGYYANNLVVLAEYLMAHGYSPEGAAGVAGAAAGESGGDPESVGTGGAGLIGWTPPSKASPYQPIVTGDAQTDFDYQLADVAQYNDDQGASNLQTLNAQTDPVKAADYYSQVFERPKITDSDVRPSVANYVYDKISGLPTTGTLTPTDKNTGSDSGGTPAQTTSILNPVSDVLSALGGKSFRNDLMRFGLIVFGGALVLVGVFMLVGKQTIKMVAPTKGAT